MCPAPLEANLGSVSERSAKLGREEGFPDEAAVELVVRVAETSDRDHPELRGIQHRFTGRALGAAFLSL